MSPMTPAAVLDSKPSPSPVPAFEHVPLFNGDLRMIYRASKFRGSVNWLNKLRASKGFPVDGDRGVDDLLSLQGSLCSESCIEQSGSNKDLEYRLAFVQEGKHADSRVAEISPCMLSGFTIPNTIACRNEAEYSSSRKFPAGLLCQMNSAAADNSSSPLKDPQLSVCIDKDDDSREITQSLDSTAQDVAQLYTNMFAELFCMDSCTVDLVQKRHRKQVKPKNCVNALHHQMPCFTLHAELEYDMSPAHGNDSGDPPTLQSAVHQGKPDLPSSPPEIQESGHTVYQKKPGPKKQSIDISRNNLDDKEAVLRKSDRRLGNEILVIDTSLQGWRIEKMIAKKRNSWKIEDKLRSLHEHSNLDCSTTVQLKQKPVPSNSIVPESVTEVQRQCELSSCKEKGDFVGAPELANIPWNPAPESQKRSRRKRRKNALLEDEPLKEISRSITRKDGTSINKTILAPDHPASQPKEGLIYSIYQVFMQAGKAGLTAREAVSRILEQGLPGLQEGGVAPRVEVLKIVSNSPYFMSLEESKYILCGALVGDEDDSSGRKQIMHKVDDSSGRKQIMPTVDDSSGRKQIMPKVEQNGEGIQNYSSSTKSMKQQGVSQYWAAYAIIKRARTGIIRRRPFCGSFFQNHVADKDACQDIGSLSQKRCLKFMKQDVTGLGNRCNRTDGKGWHCPLRAKVGYLLCDHHLHRLRSRVKLHAHSNLVLNGSWVVKKGCR